LPRNENALLGWKQLDTRNYQGIESPGITDTEVDLDELGMHYINSVTELEKATAKMTELKARVIQAMDGAKRGLIFGEHWLSLRSRAGGAPFLHQEKGK
jgi:hypothetical protein